MFNSVLGLLLIIIFCLLCPPVRDWTHKVTNVELSKTKRGISIFVFCFLFIILVGQEAKFEESELKIKAEIDRIAQVEKINTDYFNEHRTGIIKKAESEFNMKNYKHIIDDNSKYLVSGDMQLLKIIEESKDKILLEEKRKKRIKEQFSPWDGSHSNLEILIKKAMNDPDSYQHDETLYWDKDSYLLVRTVYRGKNAFGGVVKNFVKAKISLNGEILQILDQS